MQHELSQSLHHVQIIHVRVLYQSKVAVFVSSLFLSGGDREFIRGKQLYLPCGNGGVRWKADLTYPAVKQIVFTPEVNKYCSNVMYP